MSNVNRNYPGKYITVIETIIGEYIWMKEKILFLLFRSSKEWIEPKIIDEEFELCKRQGYMFDPPVKITHDEFFVKLKDVFYR